MHIAQPAPTHPFFLEAALDEDLPPSLLSWPDVWEVAEQADDRLDTDSMEVPRTNCPPMYATNCHRVKRALEFTKNMNVII